MSIRKTESRIPGGFTKANAEKLGEASDPGGPNQEFIIVAYWSSPIQAGIELPFWNRYVAFVDGMKVTGNITYEWTIKFKKNNGDLVLQASAGSPIIEVDAKNFSDPNIVLQATRVEVSLKIPSISNTAVTFIQNIQGLAQNLEDYLTDVLTNPIPSAHAGKPSISREVANRIKPYLLQADSAFGKELSIPANLTGAVAYLNILLQDHKKSKWKLPSTLLGDERLAKSINNNSTYEFFESAPPSFGVCPMSPHILSMFLPTAANPDINNIDATGPLYNTYTTYRILDGSTVTEKQVFDAFAVLTADQRADIYNQLRFPKSNIRLCAFLLNQLKKTHADWAGLTKDELKSNKACIKTIVTEMLKGPKGAGAFKFHGLGLKAHSVAYSAYMQKILEAQPSAVQYETVRIKALDVRSGRPIKNARVKRLIIDASGHRLGENRINFDQAGTVLNAEHTFTYEPGYNTSFTLQKRAQIALNELGFYVGTPDGNIGPNSIRQYERYWNSRILDGSFDLLERENGNLPQKHLQLIVDEYLNHRETDENGVLNVRIPLNLFYNRTVKIEVGFWEFPVTAEKRKHQQQTSQLIRSVTNPNTETETGFHVRWVGNQEAGWNSGNPDAEHFGWHVENPLNTTSRNLRVNEILDVKTLTTGNAIQTNILSHYFDPVAYPFHFVLFGMQWCQPVWQELPSHWIKGMIHPSSGLSLYLRAEIDPSEKFLPAICTRYNAGGGSDQNNLVQKGAGRDYGIMVMKGTNDITGDANEYTKITDYAAGTAPRIYSASSNKPHQGIDYYAVEHITPVFAPMGGEITDKLLTGNSVSPFSDYGYGLLLKVADDYIIRIAHLSENSYAETGVLPNRVLCGHFIGRAGRTFDINGPVNDADKFSDGPTHLHFEVSQNSWGIRVSDARRLAGALGIEHNIDDIKNLFLTNDSHRLFPCDCHWPTNSNWNAARCAVRTNTNNLNYISKHCWAARNLHCPYMADTSKKPFRLQAQLKYLFDDKAASGFKDPGPINGDWGTINPENEAVSGLTTGKTVTLLNGTLTDDLIKIKYQQPSDNVWKTGWVAPHIIKLEGAVYKLNIPELKNFLKNGAIGKTRKAIYYFKKETDLLDYDDYASNFETDTGFEAKLNESQFAPYPRTNLNRVDK